jgi:hypothetical protein
MNTRGNRSHRAIDRAAQLPRCCCDAARGIGEGADSSHVVLDLAMEQFETLLGEVAPAAPRSPRSGSPVSFSPVNVDDFAGLGTR